MWNKNFDKKFVKKEQKFKKENEKVAKWNRRNSENIILSFLFSKFSILPYNENFFWHKKREKHSRSASLSIY